MKQHAVALALAILAIASVARAQAPAVAPERQHALTAPANDLARELLVGVSPLFTEVERPTHVGLAGPDAPFTGAHFATEGHSAGFPGLCKATVAYIRASGSIRSDEADAPFDSWPAFKIVGDTTPVPGMWNDAYEKELEAKCHAAGRVLPATSDSFADPVFFISHSEPGGEAYDAWTAAHALQLAIASAPGTPSPQCANDPQIEFKCQDASDTLSKLNLSQLRDVTVAPCADDPKIYCVSATFFKSMMYWNEVSYWVVDLRIEPPLDDAAAVLREGKPRRLLILAIKLRPEVVTYD